MIWIYNILITLLAPIWVPLVWWKARKRKEAPNWKERCGEYALDLDRNRPVVWAHAVSVGEVVAAMPVLRELKAQKPEVQIVLSVTTSTGHETARRQACSLFDHLVYFPIDVARFMWVATWRVKPNVVAIFETELWLNFLHFAKQVKAQTLLVNGRISDRSFRRAQAVLFYYQTLVEKLDRCLMQTETDAGRIRAYGATNVDVLGNTKFDEAISSDPTAREYWREQVEASQDDIVIVVGSTRGELEENFVLSALQEFGAVRVIHAPRHIEVTDQLVERVQHCFGKPARRSKNETGRYLVLDTYGELAQAYAAADIAIVGGGFAPLGGQNIIQPMALGVPVLHGPHMQNFKDVAEMANRAGAATTCSTTAELAKQLRCLINDASARRAMGDRGRDLVVANQGASRRYAKAIINALD